MMDQAATAELLNRIAMALEVIAKAIDPQYDP